MAASASWPAAAGDRSADGDRGRPGVGVERSVTDGCSARARCWKSSSLDTMATTISIRLIPSPYTVTAIPAILLRRRRRPVIRRPRPQPASGVADEVRGEVRHARVQVRRRNRAQQRADASTSRTGRPASTSTLRRRAGLPRTRTATTSGQEPANVRLRAGPVERGPRDLEHRPAAGSHPRIQPGPGRGCLYAADLVVGPRLGVAYDLTGKDTIGR